MPPAATQAVLLEIPKKPLSEPAPRREPGERKLILIDRAQMRFVQIFIDDLIPADHKARSIWDLTGQFDLSRFAAPIRSEKGRAGRPAWDPRLLISIWIYAYSEGLSSARQIAEWMRHEPALRWLSGDQEVNHHTLSDFRVAHREALDDLFTQLLALLDQAGVISLERVMHDGTKIRAQAGADTFRRQGTLAQRIGEARELLKELDESEQQETGKKRRQAAQQRARREQVERLGEAQAEMKKLRAAARKDKREQTRVSVSEPEARIMKHADKGFRPSYNAQISTDAARTLIVGVELTQSASDAASLPAAIKRVEKNLGRKPKQVVVDGGFTNRLTIEALERQGVEMIGSLPDPTERTAAAMKSQGIDPKFGPRAFVRDEGTNTLECPAGKCLPFVRRSWKRGNKYQQYQARGEDCAACEFRKLCCSRRSQGGGRTVSLLESEAESVAAFRKRMESAEAKRIYKQRGPIAEFPNAWIKERIGLRKFRLRGLVKAGTEALWACLSYNVMQWKRLCWLEALEQQAAAG